MDSTFESKPMDGSSEAEATASLLAARLSIDSVLPMVLKTALELDLLELIKKAGPTSASASELTAQLPTKNPNATNMIDRILRFLSARSILNCTLQELPEGGVERRYSLTPVCMFLTKNEDGGSLAPLLLLNQDKVIMESWYHLKDAILEGGIPFDKAHGMNAFEYPATDQRFNQIFNKAMSEQSSIFAKNIVQSYKGFEGLKSLVDVGGGTGATINLIISKYPSIKGINFDLPHVVRDAPYYPGVEHIGGNMFVSVPKADAILMKWTCHDWSDAHCVKLLKNCYEALPYNGKVIIAEFIIPEDSNSGPGFAKAAQSDVMMLAYNPGGKERTFKEFWALALSAGFLDIRKVCYAFPLWIMELSKLKMLSNL